MKRIALLFSFLTAFLLCVADSVCDSAIKEGKDKYNAGKYAEAKQLFDYVVKHCGDSYGDASSWIRKCESALTPKLTVSKSSISFGWGSNTDNVSITSNRNWDYTTNYSFINVTRTIGGLQISVSQNPYESQRTGTITVRTTDGQKIVNISVSQAAKPAAQANISVNKTSISASAEGTTEYLTVTSNKNWEVEYASGTMYNVTRSGNTLTVVVKPNTTTENRSDFFIVKTTEGNKSVRIDLSQSKGGFSVSKTSISASASGSTEYITVTSGKSWEVEYPSGTMYSVTRSGNTLTVVIKPNTTTDSRNDFFKVKTTDGSESIRINMTQSAGTGSSTEKHTAAIENVWQEHNQYQNGIKGMLIHVKFNVQNMLNLTGNVAVYFYFDSSEDKPLKDFNNQYNTSNGNVATHKNFTPSYANSTFNDFKIFMPYSELHCNNSGRYDLKFYIVIWDNNSKQISTSDWQKFYYNP